MPLVIAPNQSGFIKGRLLSDNVLLAQELMQELAKSSPSPNIAIKLDMAKAYDRVQWPFLLAVLHQMGFDDKWISIVDRCINSNWFSVLINGSPGGFFKSSRGLRQGDPLSPALFVLAADYLSRSLDRLIVGCKESAFSTTRYSPTISHLAYADDIIIFTKASRHALKEIVECINHYSAVSGQKINTNKSQFYIAEKNPSWEHQITETCGFQRGELPFTYLGIPIFRGIKKTSMFLFLRDAVAKHLFSWSHKYLSFGGRLLLIKSTLGALPLHVFQVLEPTGGCVKMLESLIARFFWGSNNDSRHTHWIGWDQICRPVDEGGLGIRRFKDMIEAFDMKLWWRFREQDSLWATFMAKNYCTLASPLRVTVFRRHSPTWKRMVRASKIIHRHIQWSVGEGDADFWDDIWLDEKPISYFGNPSMPIPKKLIKEYWIDNVWDEAKLRSDLLPLGVPEGIVEKIVHVPIDSTGKDCMRWALTPHGNFSTSSAWELARHRQPKAASFGLIWNGALLPSISILMWRLLANRLPVDSKLQWRKIDLASKCRCCPSPRVETREHLFVCGEGARKIWEYFDRWFPNTPHFDSPSSDVEYRLRLWQMNMNNPPKLHVSIVIPCTIMWSIWSERNNVIHRGATFRPNGIIGRVIAQLQMAVSGKILESSHWKGCTPSVSFSFPSPRKPGKPRFHTVKWEPPPPEWIKINTDGAFSVATMDAGGGGVIRDERGRIIIGFSSKLQATSCWEAEVLALLHGLEIAPESDQPIWIELDALQLVNLINGGERGGAKQRHLLTTLRNRIRKRRTRVTYLPREGNKIADYLASAGSRGEVRVFNGDTAPPFVKAMAIMDQDGRPNFRQSGDDRPP